MFLRQILTFSENTQILVVQYISLYTNALNDTGNSDYPEQYYAQKSILGRR